MASLDALFDRGLISFDDSGAILVSDLLPESEQKLFGIVGARLFRPISKEAKQYLAFHRKRFEYEK